MLRDSTPLPFFARLESHGLTVAQLEETVGVYRLARAVRRCFWCSARPECVPSTPDCPNSELFHER